MGTHFGEAVGETGEGGAGGESVTPNSVPVLRRRRRQRYGGLPFPWVEEGRMTKVRNCDATEQRTRQVTNFTIFSEGSGQPRVCPLFKKIEKRPQMRGRADVEIGIR